MEHGQPFSEADRKGDREMLEPALLRLCALEVVNVTTDEPEVLAILKSYGSTDSQAAATLDSLVNHREAVRPQPGTIILTPNGEQQAVSHQWAGALGDRKFGNDDN